MELIALTVLHVQGKVFVEGDEFTTDERHGKELLTRRLALEKPKAKSKHK